MHENMEENNGNKKKPNIYLVLCIIFAIGACVCLGLWIKSIKDKADYERQYREMANSTESSSEPSFPSAEPISSEPAGSSSDVSSEEATPEPVDPYEESVKLAEEQGVSVPERVIDIANLQETVNPDIYAWIYVPGTKVDYPILQHPTDDTYYLNYNLDGKKGYPGCIYSEKQYNSKDFTDACTVLYGHNMKNGTMFGSLHRYEDEDFFYENRYIYVYTPERLLVYKIFAAYEYSNEHLLANNDFESAYSFARFFLMAKDRRSMHHIFDEDVELTGEEHIITLSTCINGKPENRFLVQGVLINEE